MQTYIGKYAMKKLHASRKLAKRNTYDQINKSKKTGDLFVVKQNRVKTMRTHMNFIVVKRGGT